MGGKRIQAARKQLNGKTAYPMEGAVKLLRELPTVKFDETVELSASLNVDAKKGDQVVRGTVLLPHGNGKTRRILVFCKGEQELRAKEAGAEHVGNAEFIEKVQAGWMEFDVVIATPDMMRDVSRLGKVLGPRGLMPNPKAGTVAPDVAKAIDEVKRGKVEFKMDKLANIHLAIGKRSFSPEQLIENGRAVLSAIVSAKPTATKGRLIRRVTLSSTMSPGVRVSVEGLETAHGERE